MISLECYCGDVAKWDTCLAPNSYQEKVSDDHKFK